MGATHALEIPFVFDNLHRAGVEGLLGDEAPPELARAMQQAWLAFVHHDDPTHDGLPEPWPAFDEDTRATMHFGVPNHLEHDPARERRQVWSGIR
jgi:para-nitrobenzyl esterase